MNKALKKISILLLAVLLAATAFPRTASAAGKILPEQDISLNVVYQDGRKGIPFAEFDIFKVADVDEYARMTLTSEFTPYKDAVSGLSHLDKLTQGEWLLLASTLKNYAADFTPVDVGFTDEEGKLSFTLNAGLYLLIGYRTTTDDYFTYSAVPYMIFLPASDEENNAWSYEVETAPKFAKAYCPEDDPADKVVTRKVLKDWDDEGYESIRPEEIMVQLLRNGRVYDEQVLSEENSWLYAWDNLDASYEWTVTETVPEDYTVSILQEGITFVLFNKYIVPVSDTNPTVQKKLTGDKPPKAEPFTFVLKAADAANPMPEGSSGQTKEITISGAGSGSFGELTFAKPGTYVYNVSEVAGNTAGYTYDKNVYTITYKVLIEDGVLYVSHTVKDSAGKEASVLEFSNNYKGSGILPQTGLLWWPVPVLLAAGVILILVGVIRRRTMKG